MIRKVLMLLYVLIFTGFLIAQQKVEDQSGFIRVDPVNYYFQDSSEYARVYHTTDTGLLWFTFLKADENAEDKPLFLFFNGGPGSGTTCGLMGFYTGRKTLDNDIAGGGDHYIDNPYSWTKMGNLLYIDARCAGFSYNLTDKERSLNNLAVQFTGKNFNSYIDAADYIRVLISFFKKNPELKKNPVIIVGESYGGVRATLMLHILLNYKDYGNGTDVYQDKALSDLIQSYYDEIFPEYSGTAVPAQKIAEKFGRQILIQPAIDSYRDIVDGDMMESEESVVYEIADQVGVPYTPCGDDPDCDKKSNVYEYMTEIAQRDLYGCHKPSGWSGSFFSNGSALLTDYNQLALITNIDPGAISELYAENRRNAYKYAFFSGEDEAFRNALYESLSKKEKFIFKERESRAALSLPDGSDSRSLEQVFGTLLDYDAFHLSLNRDSNYSYHYFSPSVLRGYKTYSYNILTGRKFLQNLIHVKTFITNAKYDLVVYTAALPGALALHTDLVSESLHLKTFPVQAQRPGQIFIRYRENAFGIAGEEESRVIRFPFYTKSSHPVSLTEPSEFYDDVFEWLGFNVKEVADENK